MIAAAIAMLSRDVYQLVKHNQAVPGAGAAPLSEPPVVRWRVPLALALLAGAPILIAPGIVVVPRALARARIGQTSATLPGTWSPGRHSRTPLPPSLAALAPGA